MLHTCVLLNGPAGSGKDTIADLMVPHGFHKHQFKEALYAETAAYYGVSLSGFKRFATDRQLKEEPMSRLDGKTPREALIHVSENVIKPQHGDTFFGDKAAELCKKKDSQLAVFADSGFTKETEPLRQIYSNLFIVRLHREGFTFDGDSRDYLYMGGHSIDIELIDKKPWLAVSTIMNHIYPTISRLPLTA